MPCGVLDGIGERTFVHTKIVGKRVLRRGLSPLANISNPKGGPGDLRDPVPVGARPA